MTNPQVDVFSIAGVNNAAVASRLAVLATSLDELGIGLEAHFGFFHDYVLRVQAALLEASAAEFAKAAYSLNPLSAPTDAVMDAAILEAVAGDIGLTRRPAVTSRGSLRVLLSSPQSMIVPIGSSFVASNGAVYQTEEPYVARADVVDAPSLNTLAIIPSAASNVFEFSLPVVAVQAGPVSPPVPGTPFSSTTATLVNLLSIEAKSGFTSGAGVESNTDLIARMRRSLSAKTMASRNSIEALFVDDDRFPGIGDVVTLGPGDAELLRGSAAGLVGNGIADVLIKHKGFPPSKTVQIVATAVGLNPDNNQRLVWAATIPQEQAAGAYWVNSVAGGTLSNVRVTGTTRQPSLLSDVGITVSNTFDLTFSTFQSIHVVVEADRNAGNIGDSAELAIDLVYVPDVPAAQAVANDRQHRLIGSDVLVRAATPAPLAVSVSVRNNGNDVLPDMFVARSAVADYINASSLGDVLQTSRIVTIVNNQLPSGIDVTDVSVLMELVRPDNTIYRSRMSGDISPPIEPSTGVSRQTAAMYCRVDDVRIVTDGGN